MAGLTGKTPKDTHKDLVQLDNSNAGLDGTTRALKDGKGVASALKLSTDEVEVTPVSNSTTAFKVSNSGGTEKLLVDTTNDYVKALTQHVNTQYAHFNVGHTESYNFVINTHHPIPYQNANYGINTYPPAFGTGTDPATTFTTADANNQRASDLVPLMWRVQDNIAIDAVTHIEGADNATGDTTRMHLFSYTFTSGSTSALTSGAVVAHSSDVTNAGSEQAYLSSWTIDSANVDSGKVILCFFRSDSINSDYSANVTIKYHLRV